MMPTTTVSVNLVATQALLKKIKGKAANLEPVLEGPIASSVHEMFGKIWRSEGAYIGNKWQQLSPQTLRAKARINRQNMGILRRYNTLWSSLVKRSSPLGYRIVTPHSLRIGTNVPYAGVHQEGTDRVPQRVIVPDEDQVPEQDRQRWESLISKYLEAA